MLLQEIFLFQREVRRRSRCKDLTLVNVIFGHRLGVAEGVSGHFVICRVSVAADIAAHVNHCLDISDVPENVDMAILNFRDFQNAIVALQVRNFVERIDGSVLFRLVLLGFFGQFAVFGKYRICMRAIDDNRNFLAGHHGLKSTKHKQGES